MTFFTPNLPAVNQKLLFAGRVSGLFLVLCVNAFVFLTNYHTDHSSSFQLITAFVDHATMEHQVNNTPFTLVLNFKATPVQIIDPLPAFPASLPQFMPAILWLLVFGLMIYSICFCFFRGEENMNTQFIPGIIIPPPKFI